MTRILVVFSRPASVPLCTSLKGKQEQEQGQKSDVGIHTVPKDVETVLLTIRMMILNLMKIITVQAFATSANLDAKQLSTGEVAILYVDLAFMV